jgi:hypothetical protein
MTYKGYALHVADKSATPGAPDEGGVYHLTTKVVDGALEATHCNDLLADAYKDIEGATGDLLAGLGGNDLIFSHGADDTLIGGEGSDLIVLSEDACNAVIRLADIDALTDPDSVDHYDTIVNFNDSHTIEFAGLTLSFADDSEQSIDKIAIGDLDAYLADAGDLAESIFLITTNGDNADIWQIRGDVDAPVLDQIAHFVDFDFSNYDFKVLPVAPVIG